MGISSSRRVRPRRGGEVLLLAVLCAMCTAAVWWCLWWCCMAVLCGGAVRDEYALLMA